MRGISRWGCLDPFSTFIIYDHSQSADHTILSIIKSQYLILERQPITATATFGLDIMAPTAEYMNTATFGEPITFPIRYEDPEYQSTHSNLFSSSLTRPLEAVLPPGVTQLHFDAAINKLKDVLGKEHVFTGRSLTEYIDPYELQEDPSRRKIPSGAVW